MINLFDPPPLASLNLAQKSGRVFLLTATLVVASILAAMLGALILFLVEWGRRFGATPQFYDGIVIILIGFAVNLGCIFALLQIKKADNKLLPPRE